MARVLVLTDRSPRDPDLKGVFTWHLIRALAESQHEVLVLTTEDPETIGITHPRLNIGRPAPNWGVEYLPKFLQGILLFRPDIIHTFAVKSNRPFSSLTIWTYLNRALKILPGVRRYSVFFEASDLRDEKDVSLSWHRGSRLNLALTLDHRHTLSQRFGLTSDILPVELDMRLSETEEGSARSYLLVPAPVSQWQDWEDGLKLVRARLDLDAGAEVRIYGGWGNLQPSERRQGWGILGETSDRVRMLESLSFNRYAEQIRGAREVVFEPLKKDSWLHILATVTASQSGAEISGPKPALSSGSPANFLSRLFAQS